MTPQVVGDAVVVEERVVHVEQEDDLVCCQVHHRVAKPPALPEDSQGSTVSGMVGVAVSNGNPIPLTLTLSHGEREYTAAGWFVREVRRADTTLGCAERQRRIPPLPEGEGRGEGKGDGRCASRVGAFPNVCRFPEGPYGIVPLMLSCLRLCRMPLTFWKQPAAGPRLPQAEPSCKGMGIVAQARSRGKSLEQFCVAAAENHIVRLKRRLELFDDLGDVAAPFLLSQPFQAGQPDVVLVGAAIFVRQVRQFHRLEDPVNNQRGTQTRAQP